MPARFEQQLDPETQNTIQNQEDETNKNKIQLFINHKFISDRRRAEEPGMKYSSTCACYIVL